jgi:hypothetical protein
MGQPVFIPVDADQIFQATRDSGFFVRLELWQVHEQIACHRRAGQ